MTMIICAVTVLAVIASVLLSLKIRIHKMRVDAYWLISVLGALSLILFGKLDIKTYVEALFEDTEINPVKILILFISMSVMSVFLDEMGFFRVLAVKAAQRVKGSQLKLFCSFYLTISLLTVFTSNDIVILTFTPFICEFCKNAKINPTPYIISEFVAANSWSMLLIIGNPTNIFIAASNGIGFAEYVKFMLFPTLAGGVVSFALCLLIFGKMLRTPFSNTDNTAEIENGFLTAEGVVCLAVCIVMMAVGNIIDIPMWIISFAFALIQLGIALLYSLKNKRYLPNLKNAISHAPRQAVPFVISMFGLVVALKIEGFTVAAGEILGNFDSVFSYGISSYAVCNLCNNIPMSLLFSEILKVGNAGQGAVFATVIGSNLGALLTPVGALAGIMWSGLVRGHGVKLSFLKFLLYGAAISIPTLLISLAVLKLFV